MGMKMTRDLKKAAGRQISQRAWQMVRSSKKQNKKAPASHRNSLLPLASENPFTSLNLDVSLILSTVALLRPPLVSCSLLYMFCLCPSAFPNTDFVGRQHQLQQFDICGQCRGRRPVLDLPCGESRTTRLRHGRHFETRRPM